MLKLFIKATKPGTKLMVSTLISLVIVGLLLYTASPVIKSVLSSAGDDYWAMALACISIAYCIALAVMAGIVTAWAELEYRRMGKLLNRTRRISTRSLALYRD